MAAFGDLPQKVTVLYPLLSSTFFFKYSSTLHLKMLTGALANILDHEDNG